MSELVSRLAVQHLRNIMFPALPQNVRDLFPSTTDPLVSGQTKVPNIVVGQYQDFGANAATPMIAVSCSGAQEGIVNVYRHLDMQVDIWIGGNVGPNVDGRIVVSIIYEYLNRSLQNVNWSGVPQSGSDYVQVKRCYETERSPIMFEPTNKIYHILTRFRVEALCKSWY